MAFDVVFAYPLAGICSVGSGSLFCYSGISCYLINLALVSYFTLNLPVDDFSLPYCIFLGFVLHISFMKNWPVSLYLSRMSSEVEILSLNIFEAFCMCIF